MTTNTDAVVYPSCPIVRTPSRFDELRRRIEANEIKEDKIIETHFTPETFRIDLNQLEAFRYQ